MGRRRRRAGSGGAGLVPGPPLWKAPGWRRRAAGRRAGGIRAFRPRSSRRPARCRGRRRARRLGVGGCVCNRGGHCSVLPRVRPSAPPPRRRGTPPSGCRRRVAQGCGPAGPVGLDGSVFRLASIGGASGDPRAAGVWAGRRTPPPACRPVRASPRRIGGGGERTGRRQLDQVSGDGSRAADWPRRRTACLRAHGALEGVSPGGQCRRGARSRSVIQRLRGGPTPPSPSCPSVPLPPGRPYPAPPSGSASVVPNRSCSATGRRRRIRPGAIGARRGWAVPAAAAASDTGPRKASA